MALRLAEVQQPNRATTPSSIISRARLGNRSARERVSGAWASTIRPRIPPAALICSQAKSSASRTEASLMAIVPVWECSSPIGTVEACFGRPTEQPTNRDGAKLRAAASVAATPPVLKNSRRANG